MNEEGEVLALKLHRLGRTSFRAVKNKRDYLRQRNSFSWLYLSRLSALKEFAFMKALGAAGLPVPVAVDHNRHAVLMSLVPATPLVQVGLHLRPVVTTLRCNDVADTHKSCAACWQHTRLFAAHGKRSAPASAGLVAQIRELMNPGVVYAKLMDLMAQLAALGLVHCDFNEFNILASAVPPAVQANTQNKVTTEPERAERCVTLCAGG